MCEAIRLLTSACLFTVFRSNHRTSLHDSRQDLENQVFLKVTGKLMAIA